MATSQQLVGPIQSVFGSMVLALLPAVMLDNFKYILASPLHIWFDAWAFGVGRSNGSGWVFVRIGG